MKYFIVSLFFISFIGSAKTPLSSSRLTKLSGENIFPIDSKSVWDQRYSKKHYIYGKLPAKFLVENFDFLKPGSLILDMGMGEGRNAVFLAQKGHKVTGVDISSVAVKKAKLLAKEKDVRIKTVVGTLDKYEIRPHTFDAIISFYFVSRELNKKIMRWLKPDGILIYEAHTINEYKKHPNLDGKKNSYLDSTELLSMFPKMQVLKYEEPLHEQEYRASIILKKKGKI